MNVIIPKVYLVSALLNGNTKSVAHTVGQAVGSYRGSCLFSSLSEKAPSHGWWTADMQAELSVDNNETSARMVKARLEKTVLGQVTAHIKAVLQPAAGFISIRLDLEVIAKLQLSVTPHSVGTALLKQSKLKLKTDNIRCGFGLVVIHLSYKVYLGVAGILLHSCQGTDPTL